MTSYLFFRHNIMVIRQHEKRVHISVAGRKMVTNLFTYTNVPSPTGYKAIYTPAPTSTPEAIFVPTALPIVPYGLAHAHALTGPIAPDKRKRGWVDIRDRISRGGERG